MKLLATTIAAAVILPRIAALTVNTPTSVVQCQPAMLTWSGGSPPYYLALIPGGQVSATALESFDTQNGNQYTWIANLPAGTSFTVSLKDSTGLQAYSDAVSVQSSSDTSCMNASSSFAVNTTSKEDDSPSATTAAAGGNAPPPASTDAPHTAGPSSAASAASHASSAAGSAASDAHSTSATNPSATVRPNSAVSHAVSYGVLGAFVTFMVMGILP